MVGLGSPRHGGLIERHRSTSSNPHPLSFVVGFKEVDLLRVGCSRPEVVALASHAPSNMRAAGISVEDLLRPDAQGGLLDAPKYAEQQLGGFRGAAALRSAGYSARDVSSAQVHTAWDLKQVRPNQGALFATAWLPSPLMKRC